MNNSQQQFSEGNLFIEFAKAFDSRGYDRNDIESIISAFSLVLKNTTDFQYNSTYLRDFTEEFIEYVELVKEKNKLVCRLRLEDLIYEDIAIVIDEFWRIDNYNSQLSIMKNNKIENLFNTKIHIKVILKDNFEEHTVFAKRYNIKDRKIMELTKRMREEIKCVINRIADFKSEEVMNYE